MDIILIIIICVTTHNNDAEIAVLRPLGEKNQLLRWLVHLPVTSEVTATLTLTLRNI